MIPDKIAVNIAGGLDIALPPMARVAQRFASDRLEDPAAVVGAQFARPEIRERVQTGHSIAVGCGSRGIANSLPIVAAVIAELKALGAKPFVFPCMGSHGAATAAGQRDVLGTYGLTEDNLGVSVRATMDTVVIGEALPGVPVQIDRNAAEADGIVVINRIKPHTSFRAPVESGLTKMLSIGIGKIAGAAVYHQQGMDTFIDVLPKVRDVVLAQRSVLFGVGIVENAYDETAHIELVPGEALAHREPELLQLARERMPKLYFSEIDVLVIDEMGKNISGAGFDPNIVGRNRRAIVDWPREPSIKKIAVLGLTRETHGNATGLGSADVVTMRLYREVDIASTYANIITSMNLDGASIPMVMNTDQEAIALAVKTVVRVQPQDCRIVRIRNTLQLGEIEVSAALLPEVRAQADQLTLLADPQPWQFDGAGRLSPLVHSQATAA